MLNLILGYLIIVTILFSANIGLFLGDFNFNDKKSIVISILIGIIFFIVISIPVIITFNLTDYLSYIFIAVSIIIFLILFAYLKTNNLKISISALTVLYYITSFILASQLGGYSIINSLLLSFTSIIFIFIAFQASKLLMFAKRQYNVLIGEYMSLIGILIFIFGLTYMSVIQLDYEMFSPFLILTPTYQLIYVIIGIIIVLIIGTYWNDKKNLR